MTTKIIPITGKRTKDLTGQRFTRWTVIGYTGKDNRGHSLWLARCDCGTERVVHGNHLTNGQSKSCGCLSPRYTIHGFSKLPEYQAWRHMIRRCEVSNKHDYHRYGGRGIKGCQRWRESFEAFLSDMGKKPSVNHSLDRIDNDKGYSPDNCRWATADEQNNNKSTNRRLTFNGRTLTVAQWAREIGITSIALQGRLHKGWTIEHALTEPARKRGPNKRSCQA